MNTQAMMEINDDVRTLGIAELDDVSGAMLHAGFNLGGTRFDIVATEYQYMVIQTDCSCRF